MVNAEGMEIINVTATISRDDYNDLKKLARAEERSLSAYVRWLIRQALSRQPQRRGAQ